MIKFRQKEYSKPLTKVIYSFRKASKGVSDTIKGGLESLGRSQAQTRGNTIPAKTVQSPTNRYRVKRLAVKDSNNMRKIPDRVNYAVNQAALDPGYVVNQGVELAVRNPISTTTGVAGKVVMFAPGVPNILRVAPIGNAGLVAEQGLKRVSPGYKKVTENLANYYRDNIGNRVGPAINVAANAFKAQSMYF